MPPNAQPKSREEAMSYLRDVAGVSVQAADTILAAVKPADPLYDKAAMLKLESLMRLSQFGDEQAAADMQKFAGVLATSPVPVLSMEAKRVKIVGDAQAMFSEEKFDAAPSLVTRVAALLKAAPNDEKTVGMAIQLYEALEEGIPDGGRIASEALAILRPILTSSPNETIKAKGESMRPKR